MAAILLDGRAHASRLRDRIARQVTALADGHGIAPGLAVVLVGEDPASQVYVHSKGRLTREVGMRSFQHRLPADTDSHTLLNLIASLNADPDVHGILVQLPLPSHLDAAAIIDAIDPAKDVDGFHVQNAGRLAVGLDAMVPCTPLGCMMILRDHLGSLAGANAVVLGRSNIVGKPMAQLLLAADCTVTTAHSRTRDIADIARQADILVAAIGRPGIVTADWIKPGATVIDVGINRISDDEGKTVLVGDCAPECASVAGAITPVPGGVGPMTIACLLQNTVTACCRIAGIPVPAV
ncbi:folD bifunctional protein [Oceaniovalibus guishaninsula JLT2003]|uniref:Bifunctional protein FolD n=1 Tax=Oceaniovalibus guishaninsula JLT2003 TaxID=1231392 RepID=K2GP17_9RHOB|nr:bifunctional methylenetetrahydrofolate dehydrogenase/methenyltetrahydrofolate cyclohydrolase FolD [Oceaniovalibus guishaninsula]EKE44441.1 folD bifunctional protein [Oceaniovalibus guishaninsula JLT2003]